MNREHLSLAALVVACLLALFGRVDGDAALAFIAGSVLSSPVPTLRRVIGR